MWFFGLQFSGHDRRPPSNIVNLNETTLYCAHSSCIQQKYLQAHFTAQLVEQNGIDLLNLICVFNSVQFARSLTLHQRALFLVAPSQH